MYNICMYFRPIHFSSDGNLKVIFETTFRHLSFSSFILTSYNICKQSLLLNFRILLLKSINYYYSLFKYSDIITKIYIQRMK